MIWAVIVCAVVAIVAFAFGWCLGVMYSANKMLSKNCPVCGRLTDCDCERAEKPGRSNIVPSQEPLIDLSVEEPEPGNWMGMELKRAKQQSDDPKVDPETGTVPLKNRATGELFT